MFVRGSRKGEREKGEGGDSRYAFDGMNQSMGTKTPLMKMILVLVTTFFVISDAAEIKSVEKGGKVKIECDLVRDGFFLLLCVLIVRAYHSLLYFFNSRRKQAVTLVKRRVATHPASGTRTVSSSSGAPWPG